MSYFRSGFAWREEALVGRVSVGFGRSFRTASLGALGNGRRDSLVGRAVLALGLPRPVPNAPLLALHGALALTT